MANPKNFSLQTQRLAECWGFEQLSSAIAWGALQVVRQPKYVWFLCRFQGMIYLYAGIERI